MAWSQCNTLVREAIYIFPRTCPAPDRKRVIFLGHVQRPDIVTRSDKNTCFLASHIYSLLISAAPYPIWLCIPGRTPPCCHSYHFSQQQIRGVPVEPWLNESRRSRLNPANSGFHLAFICEDHWLTTTQFSFWSLLRRCWFGNFLLLFQKQMLRKSCRRLSEWPSIKNQCFKCNVT